MSASSSDEVRWSFATRVAFRFVFVFIGLFFFPSPLDILHVIGNVWTEIWSPFVIAAGRFLFGRIVDMDFTGSGDTSYHWAQLFAITCIAVAATLVWSIFARQRANHTRLHRWFQVYARFSLATAMISYGAYKVIPAQFGAVSLDRLVEPFGAASPMGLLWTFMAASVPYTIFTGLGETIGGLLLTNRRTALLGALVSAGVMTHVVMLNYAYDVPVKIYSSMLLLTAIVIIAPDAKRLLHFFVLDRPSESLFADRRLRIAACIGVVVLVANTLFTQFRDSRIQRQSIMAARQSTSPLRGVWNVDELTIDGIAHPPLTTDLTRWRRLVVSGKNWGAIQTMDDTRTYFTMNFDEKRKLLTLKKRLDPKFQATLAFAAVDARTLRLTGPFEGKQIAATLHKIDENSFLLLSRGFHWISERPFNR